MNIESIVKVDYSAERLTVSARDLWEYMEVKTAFKDWFPRMCEYGFTEGTDFNPLKIERVQTEGGRSVTREVSDAALTIDMAKEVAMLQRTEKGKEIRRALIQLEKDWNSPEKVIARAGRLNAAYIKATDAETRLLRERNREKKLDNDRFALELKSAKLYGAAKGADKAVFADLLRRNGINVPEEAPPEPEPDIDFEAALEILRRVGESAGTRKRYRNAEYLCVPAPEAREALNGQGFDPRAVFDFARSAGMLRVGKKGYSFTACIDGQPVNCLWIASANVDR